MSSNATADRYDVYTAPAFVVVRDRNGDYTYRDAAYCTFHVGPGDDVEFNDGSVGRVEAFTRSGDACVSVDETEIVCWLDGARIVRD